MNKGYDNVSWFYDRLSRLVFGNKLHAAECYFLSAIMPADNILIAGGGSGLILEDITKLHPRGLSITYIDASPKMIALAQERNAGDNKVSFIASPVQNIKLSSDYDVIITPFLFDNFAGATATEVFKHLDRSLHSNGQWLYTDFRNTGKAKHGLLLKSMYMFFGTLCGIRTSTLPDMDALFAQHAYELKKESSSMNGFVASMVYVKQ